MKQTLNSQASSTENTKTKTTVKIKVGKTMEKSFIQKAAVPLITLVGLLLSVAWLA